MPIDRAPYNALVDDDGTGTGTLWNKAAIATSLLDPIDRSCFTKPYTSGATGEVQQFDPTQSNAPVYSDLLIMWYGSAYVVFDGLTPNVGGVEGRRVTFVNAGTARMMFQHNTSYVPSGTRFFLPMHSAPLTIGIGGSAAFMYYGGQWQLLSMTHGAWIDSGHTFSGTGSLSFTSVTVSLSRYAIVGGNSLQWSFNISGTVSGAGTGIVISAPGGPFQIASGWTIVNAASAGKPVLMTANNTTNLTVYFDLFGGAGNWPTGNANILGVVTFELR